MWCLVRPELIYRLQLHDCLLLALDGVTGQAAASTDGSSRWARSASNLKERRGQKKSRLIGDIHTSDSGGYLLPESTRIVI